MHPAVKKYLSERGRKGGLKSKRKITPEQQAKMQDARKRNKERTTQY